MNNSPLDNILKKLGQGPMTENIPLQTLHGFIRDGFFPQPEEILKIPRFASCAILRCVAYCPQMKPHRCYENCEELSQQIGGEVLDGWRFLTVPFKATRGYIRTSSHTILRLNGQLLDPTPYTNEVGINITPDGMPFIIDPQSYFEHTKTNRYFLRGV